jgi:hypothetical protein
MNYYRKCHTVRELTEFCSGTFPDIARTVRHWYALGYSGEKVKRMLHAVKYQVIYKHEESQYPREELLKALEDKS